MVTVSGDVVHHGEDGHVERLVVLRVLLQQAAILLHHVTRRVPDTQTRGLELNFKLNFWT
jgi:hypothetical protein